MFSSLFDLMLCEQHGNGTDRAQPFYWPTALAAIWTYPLANSDADQGSFNMVAAMMCRIHQSGRLDALTPGVSAQVTEGIRIYKEVLRKHIPSAVPFYPLGTSDVTNREAPIALGMRARTNFARDLEN